MPEAILHLSEKNFDAELESSPGPILVDFWAPWCPPCRRITPILEELSTEYAGRVRIGKVNVDENPPLAARFGVQSIPALILFRNGKVLEQAIGELSMESLRDLLDRYL